MVTFDLLSGIMYAQMGLSLILFFFVQLLVLFARERMDDIGDWVVYRGSWLGIGGQLISMAALAGLVFSTQTDPSRVGWTCVLIFANTAWFVALRLVFLIVDYKYSRQREPEPLE